MPDDPERFFLLHVQKAAGTSLMSRLQHHFGKPAVYPDRSDGDEDAVISVQRLEERWRARRDEIRVIAGHFPLCAVDLLGGGFTTLTILREPIERTLSYLRHRRQEAPEDRDKSLEEIYRDPYRFEALVHNHMTKMFSLTPDEATAWALESAEIFSLEPDRSAPWILAKVEFTPARLERAKEGLASVDAIGFQEHFDDFCGELSRRFGWDLGPQQHVNRTGSSEISPAFRARIAKDNAMDVELYEFALELCERRRSAPSRVFMQRP